MARTRRLPAVVGTMLVLGSCGPGPLVPIEDVSVSDVAGVFALRGSSVNASGVVLVADTVALAPDKSAWRHSYYVDETGRALSRVELRGSFEVGGSSVAMRFYSYSSDDGYAYGWGPVSTLTAMGRSGRVTRLTVETPDWKGTYDRIHTR